MAGTMDALIPAILQTRRPAGSAHACELPPRGALLLRNTGEERPLPTIHAPRENC